MGLKTRDSARGALRWYTCRIQKSLLRSLRILPAIAATLAVTTSTLSPFVANQSASAATSGSGVCQQTYETSPVGGGSHQVDVDEDGAYCYVAFKNIGSPDTQASFTWAVPSGVTSAKVLVVAGGGGGGAHVGAGGGAGGVIDTELSSLVGSITIAVGAGGRPTSTNAGTDVPVGTAEQWGKSGRDSSFASTTALGGGRGGFWYNHTGNGIPAAGGSGGGGVDGTGSTEAGGTGTVGQGNAGGHADRNANQVPGANGYLTGGGGGAATVGGDASHVAGSLKSGDGGAGVLVNWLPTSVASLDGIAVGERYVGISDRGYTFAGAANGTYFGGGGGGGYHTATTTSQWLAGSAAIGGGGAGIGPTTETGLVQAQSGKEFTGGGGGGAGAPSSGSLQSIGGTGGSGVVVIRYEISPYTISFNANGADGGSAPDNQSKTHGSALTLATNSRNLVREGFVFGGWNTQANGLGTTYPAGGTFTENATRELFALWLDSLMAYEPFSGSGDLVSSTGTGSTGFTGNWVLPNSRKQNSAALSGVRTSRPSFDLPVNSGFNIPASNVAASGPSWFLYNSVRQLSAPISFDLDGDYYLSFISHSPLISGSTGSNMAGLISGLPATDADTDPWSLLFGSPYAGKFSIDYGNANRATWVAGQTRLTADSYSAVGTKTSTGTTEQTAFFVVAKITTSASGNDSMALRAYAPSETLPLTVPTDWDVQYSAPITGTANYLAVETEYHGTVDEVRLGRTYAAVANPQAPFVAPVPPADDYSIDFAGTSRSSARGGSTGNPVGIVPSAQSFTWEAWVNPTAPTSLGQRYILDSFSGSGSDGAARLWIEGAQNNAIFGFRYDSAEGGRDSVTWSSETNYVRYGEWQHVAVTYERSSEGDCSTAATVTATLYIDGVQAGQNSSSNMGCLAPKGLSIGDATEDAYSNEFYDGKIDQVKIWEGALTQAEVANSMASYAQGSVDNTLRAHYSFNELGSSPVAGDVVDNLAASGANYDLALYSQTAGNVASNVTRNLNTFDINYDSNGADSGSVSSSASGPYKDVTVSGQGSLLRSTYSFSGWHTTASGTGGADYAASDTYTMSYRDLDLYAQWTSLLQSVTPTLSYTNATYSLSGVVAASINTNNHDGTPTFTSQSGSICSVDSDGDATILRAGTCSISASFPETSNYRSAEVSASFTISRAAQAALVWDSTKVSYDYLGNLDLTGIVSGGSGDGTLSFSATGCTVTGLTLSGGSPISDCRVTVTKGADVNYSASSELDQDITINKIDQTALAVVNPGTVVYGQTIQLSSTGGSGTGAVSFISTSTSICTETSNDGEFEIIGVGDCVVKVNKLGDTNYEAAAEVSRTIATVKATHSLSFTSTVPANPIVNGTYSVSGVSSTGESALAPNFRVAAGSASICSISGSTVSFLLDGACEIEGFKVATSNYEAASTITQRIVVGQANQSITFGSLANRTFGDPAFTLSGTSTSENDVTFTTGSGTTNSACSVTSAGLVVIADVGTCEVVANSASGNGYAAASPISRTFEISPDTAGAPFITAISFGDGSLTATYFAPGYLGGGTISGYQLQAFEESGSQTVPVATESSCAISGTLSCTISGLDNGTSYKLRIAAITEAGLGALSPVSAAATPAAIPEAVSALTAIQGDGKLILTWRAPSSLGGGTLDSFRVYHREAGASYPGSPLTIYPADVAGLTANGVTTYEITGLTNGQAYDVKVITVTTANLANLTSATTEVTQTPYTVPDAPLSVTVLDMPDDIVITWSEPVFDGGSAISDYSVLLDSVAATCTATSTTSCTISKSNLTPGETVSIDVKAENDAGLSSPASTTFTLVQSFVSTPDTSTPVITIPGPAANIEAVTGETWAWTKRISNNQVKVYIKFPEMGSNYQINLQKNSGDYVRKMSKTINTTADNDLRVVGESYYLVRTIALPGEGRYRIELIQDGKRLLLNGQDRPAVYSYR